MFFYKFPSGPFDTNAILIGCSETKKAAVIDPSLGSTDPILEKASEGGVSIEKILLTHSHWDHIADLHVLKNKTHAPIYVHPLDAQNVEHPGSDGIPLFFPIKSAVPDHFLQDGDVVEIGHLKLKVIHTPGHSPGAVCFYIESEKLLISGDTLFKGTIGNLQLPTAEPGKMRESLRRLSELPPDTHVVPGHGDDTTIGDENRFFQN
ncbi:MAG: MBL fold hydrolase [Chlamydiae bacterium RIFCSPHIGHO2_12_FULL_49_9]|nr:MAG: MBL fold hydrolase [Chlamydiae bacterium RIFCSPHIGHO2_12_FULL_49_9]